MTPDEIRKLVREVILEELAELLGRGDDLIPITRIAAETGLDSAALRMRARRRGILMVRVGRGAAVRAGDLPRLLERS